LSDWAKKIKVIVPAKAVICLSPPLCYDGLYQKWFNQRDITQQRLYGADQ